jgi:hypothetical protein
VNAHLEGNLWACWADPFWAMRAQKPVRVIGANTVSGRLLTVNSPLAPQSRKEDLVKDHGGVRSALRASLMDAMRVPTKQQSEPTKHADRLESR